MMHSFLSTLQVLPMYPGGQLQLNIPVMGLVSQWEPSLQGLLIQASSLWQSKPVFPWGQRQIKEATRSMQVEPGLHAAVAQSSMFSEQSGPLQPLTHTQT